MKELLFLLLFGNISLDDPRFETRLEARARADNLLFALLAPIPRSPEAYKHVRDIKNKWLSGVEYFVFKLDPVLYFQIFIVPGGERFISNLDFQLHICHSPGKYQRFIKYIPAPPGISPSGTLWGPITAFDQIAAWDKWVQYYQEGWHGTDNQKR